MLLLFSIRVADRLPVGERAVHSFFVNVYKCVCVCDRACVRACVCVLLFLLVLKIGCGIRLY